MKWPLSKTFQRLSTLSGDLHGRVVLAIFLLSSLLALTTAMGCHTFLVAHDTSMPLTPSVAFGAVMWLWWAAVASGMWACATYLIQENSNYSSGGRESRLSRTPRSATGDP